MNPATGVGAIVQQPGKALSGHVVNPNDELDMNITVSCYAGHRGEETPRSFRIYDWEVVISDVLDRWLAPDHRYFKVRGIDTGVYILRHDPNADNWELFFYAGT